MDGVAGRCTSSSSGGGGVRELLSRSRTNDTHRKRAGLALPAIRAPGQSQPRRRHVRSSAVHVPRRPNDTVCVAAAATHLTPVKHLSNRAHDWGKGLGWGAGRAEDPPQNSIHCVAPVEERTPRSVTLLREYCFTGVWRL